MSQKYSETAIYELLFRNGTGPATGRWNKERNGFIVNHPLAGPGCFFPEDAIEKITNVIYL